MPKSATRIPQMIEQHEADILAEWLRHQQNATRSKIGVIGESALREDSSRFLKLLSQASGQGVDPDAANWDETRHMLADLSRSRATLGFTPQETANFIFSLKQPLFDRLRKEMGNDAQGLAEEIWTTTQLLDTLGLHTMQVYQKSREEIIQRQQQEMLELSTPVTQLWDGILAIPLIGTLDSERTQVVMESLLQQIVDTSAAIAIIDITGVPTVDTLVAQHLLKTVVAARLMGAECTISGIRPQIAQTIVALGIEFGDIATKSSLADALRYVLGKTSQAKRLER
jgi:rsbT co-antagonist protein RsbR